VGHLLHLRKVSHPKCSWTVLSDQVGFIILGLALTVLVSMLSVALPAVKERLATRLFRKKYNSTLLVKERDTIVSENEDDGERAETAGEHIFGFFYILVYSLFHIATMMLIMTYNGYVVIAVIVGLTLGYALFGMECDKDKNVPVNCCA
jgi:hypothetical protein